MNDKYKDLTYNPNYNYNINTVVIYCFASFNFYIIEK